MPELENMAMPIHPNARQQRAGAGAIGYSNASLLERQGSRESNARSYPKRLPIAVDRAAGSYVVDVEGRTFIDFLTGAGVLPLGHCHPEVLDAAHRQLDKFTHGLDLPTPARDEFTTAQLSMLPQSMRERVKVHFCGPTGADAVEAAVKLCKVHTGGDEVISFQGSYHGCTHGALSLSGLRSMKLKVAGRMPGVHFLPFPSCGSCGLGLEKASCRSACTTLLERMLHDTHSGLAKPAAVLMELVQGEGGVNLADRESVRTIRKLTRAAKVPLIVDEVQTGCGRTGTWFAFEHYGIEPDVICASKALSGMGAPVALIIYRKELDSWETGDHIGTFRGNQIAFAAGSTTVRVIARDRVLDNVGKRGEQLVAGLKALGERSALIKDVRGLGLMLGVELRGHGGLSAEECARRVQQLALERGLILELGGRNDTVVRLLPPLNVSEETVKHALEILSGAFEDVERSQREQLSEPVRAGAGE